MEVTRVGNGPLEGSETVEKGKGLFNGIYIVEDVPVLFTADKGASKTIISTRVFYKME